MALIFNRPSVEQEILIMNNLIRKGVLVRNRIKDSRTGRMGKFDHLEIFKNETRVVLKTPEEKLLSVPLDCCVSPRSKETPLNLRGKQWKTLPSKK